ncbi:MAG: UPF0149 family protein [Candidatus Thioglobus sp.]|nr:MAG: UPF0149 family protein [Candidatus Thioglobus sp.]
MVENSLDYEQLKGVLYKLNTDDTIASAHGTLCGFACVKPDLSLDDWLAEVLGDDGVVEQETTKQKLAQIYSTTLEQLGDATLGFELLIADENCSLKEQANTLAQWCQGFLFGLGLQKISTYDEAVLEMIKDFSGVTKLDSNVIDSEENANDLSEIVEFVRMGVLMIQETLVPSSSRPYT